MSVVGAVHTTRLVIEPVHRSISGAAADLQISHVLDEGILRRLAELGRITPEIVDWLTAMVGSAERAGAGLAVVSCSSLSPCVNEVRNRVGIPVLKVDEPMMEYAVEHGERIGLVMTNPTTETPSTLLFSEVASRFSSQTELVSRLCPGAFAKLTSGDVEGHDREVVQVIKQLLEQVDIVMLAQISIAPVRNQLDKDSASRVVSSLDFIGSRVGEILARGR
ncbi:MAG: aspartate/glutamate racemase family protein [Desulfofustis sp.]|nr:aspartate/glutamate racemase family protein [Desulfofustis sp.]